MTLDEAIKYHEEKAKELRTPRVYEDIEGNLCATETCEECAEEHEQLAEWLKELKTLRHTVSLLKFNIHALNELVKEINNETDN